MLILICFIFPRTTRKTYKLRIEALENWAGNFSYGADRYHYPETVEQVQDLVTQCNRVKTLGSRHSFNNIADSSGDIISLQQIQKPMVLDRYRQTVTVCGGDRYGDVAEYINREGYALHNMASLPHISIAGACATATHGSGNGNLATAVSAMEIVKGDGSLVSLSREQEGVPFDGMVVSLGGLGVITSVTLDVIPSFEMRQVVYENLPVPSLIDHFVEIMSSAYSVSLFIDWQSDVIDQVWLKHRVGDETLIPDTAWHGATPAPDHRHPIRSRPADGCTLQMGLAGAWHERLPHFLLEFTPSHGEELQSEYFVPRENAVAAILAVMNLRQYIAPVIKISEIRSITADSLWMSPCYGRDSVALHFTWQKDWAGVKQVLPMIESLLIPFGVRPHWGKLFTLSPRNLQMQYEKLADFRLLLMQYDPHGKFRNGFLDTYLYLH